MSTWYDLRLASAATAVVPEFPDDRIGMDAGGRCVWLRGDDGTPLLTSTVSLAVVGVEITEETVGVLNRLLASAGIVLSVNATYRRCVVLDVQGGTAGEALAALRSVEADRATRALIDRLAASRLDHVNSPLGERTPFGAKSPFGVKSPFAGAERAALAVVGDWRPRSARATPARPPVVAVIDSGIGSHPWLVDGLPCWTDARELGWQTPGKVLPSPDLANASPSDGRLDTFAGHGTFVAGLIRQAAPAARLLSLQVMNGAGGFDRCRNLDALAWLVEQVRRSHAEPSLFVDVVCYAHGYYQADPLADAYTSALRSLLGELGDLGVQVVAAAGNDHASAPAFPAAFTTLSAKESVPATPLISVGARNPDGSRATYSNFGDWVLAWEQGTALVSTLPVGFGTEVARAVTAEYDEDNPVGGLARWGGTSFATAVLAGRLAGALADEADIAGVDASTVHARVERVRRAVLEPAVVGVP